MRGLLQHKLVLLLTCTFLFFSGTLKSAQYLTFGPEVYHMTRIRKGGTAQRGCMTGLRLTYDRIERCSLYWGGDFFYACGRLDGHNSRSRPINSDITDNIVEGRVGFTFQQSPPRAPFFTPYIGYGHFHEKNAFNPPSPILITFTDTFNYVSSGFLSGVNLTPLLSMGINFKVQFILKGQSQVHDDPLYDEITLKFRNEINARIEVPLIYRFTFCRHLLSAIVAPFYEFRHFGGQEGFPFDFIDTKFHLLGARVALGYAF